MTRINPGRPRSRFRNGSNKRLTKALFVEYSSTGLYTLDPHDRPSIDPGTPGTPSLKRLYLELEDLTEYSFATAYLEDWAHWEALCSSPTILPHIQQWRKELQLKIKSESLARLLVRARSSDKDLFPLNRYLVEGKWDEQKSKAGRPTKKAIAEEAEKIAADIQTEADDYDRILGTQGTAH